MSHAASTWAYSQTIKPASRKFVLVALADNADVHGRAYPSIVTLGLKTGLDRKTIIAALDSLEADGYLHDTDERIGATRQVKVYRLNAFSDEAHYAAPRVPGAKSQASNRTVFGTVEQSQKRNSTENGTVPFLNDNSTVFPTKEYRFSHVTVPKTVHGTVSEPSIEPSVNRELDERQKSRVSVVESKEVFIARVLAEHPEWLELLDEATRRSDIKNPVPYRHSVLTRWLSGDGTPNVSAPEPPAPLPDLTDAKSVIGWLSVVSFCGHPSRDMVLGGRSELFRAGRGINLSGGKTRGAPVAGWQLDGDDSGVWYIPAEDGYDSRPVPFVPGKDALPDHVLAMVGAVDPAKIVRMQK